MLSRTMSGDRTRKPHWRRSGYRECGIRHRELFQQQRVQGRGSRSGFGLGLDDSSRPDLFQDGSGDRRLFVGIARGRPERGFRQLPDHRLRELLLFG